MPDYKEMYFRLFNKVTDAIGLLNQAQQESEEIFISSHEPQTIDLIQNNDNKEEVSPK